MEIIKLLGAVIIACILNLLIKEYRREYSPLISICCGGVIFACVMPYITEIIKKLTQFSARLGVDGDYVLIAMKIIGISYITQLSCEMCRDAGENSLAVNMEFAGKIMLTGISVPVIIELVGIVERILP